MLNTWFGQKASDDFLFKSDFLEREKIPEIKHILRYCLKANSVDEVFIYEFIILC